jgi:hypothetical protein
MARHRLKEWPVERFKVALPFALCIAAGTIGLYEFTDSPDKWHTFWLSVFGLLIQIGIAGLIVDFVMMKKLLETTGEYVSDRITASHLPENLRKEITEILRTDLVRQNYRKTYRFERLANGLSVETTTTWEVKNYGSADVEYGPSYQEAGWLQPIPLYFEYGIKGEKTFVYEGASLGKLLKVDDCRVHTVTTTKDNWVKLRPLRDICAVTFKSRMITPEDFQDITSLYATENVVIEVYESPEWLEFSVNSTGAKKLVSHTVGSHQWLCHGPFVGGQHVNAIFRVRR